MAKVWEVAQGRDCVSRRHHYVPQAYLRAWSTNGRRIRVIDTIRGTDQLQGVKDTCVAENFYRVIDPTNRQHNQVEAMLAVLDEETARLSRLLRAWRPGDDFTFEDFISLAVVVGVQANRTPQFRRFVGAQGEWLARRAGQQEARYTTDTYVDALFKTVYKAADLYSTRQLEFWDDPRGRFITSDQPVVMSKGRPEWPPDMASSEFVWWPISPHRLVTFAQELTGEKIGHRVVRTPQVRVVRAAFIRGAESVIISRPGDPDLPTRAAQRRPQLQADCWPAPNDREACAVRLSLGYGSEIIDNACQPLCAMRQVLS